MALGSNNTEEDTGTKRCSMQELNCILYFWEHWDEERRVPLYSDAMQEHGEYWLHCCERDWETREFRGGD